MKHDSRRPRNHSRKHRSSRRIRKTLRWRTYCVAQYVYPLSVQGAVYATERESDGGDLVLTKALWDQTTRWKLEEVKPRASKGTASAADAPLPAGAPTPPPPIKV